VAASEILAAAARVCDDPNVKVGRASIADDVVVVGTRPHPLRDAYHFVLRMRIGWLLALIAAVYLVINALFAVLYWLAGGVSGASGSLKDAFFFSVQTMGTIGYGAMFPTGTLAHALVTAESIVSMLVTALVTGVIFARFSQSTGQLVFSDKVAIAPMNGVPTLAFRVGNDRASTVFEARVRLSLIRTEITKEGMTFYRLVDMQLTRDSSQALARSWTVMHPIDEKSPLFGATPESCEKQEVELVVMVVGTDDTSLQPVHGRTRYVIGDIVWGARHADVLRELPDGRIELDITKFDDLIVTEPTENFPYPPSS
jgi:inward rectifier potassium channel